MSDEISIYIHIPFCSHMCSYCAFNTFVGINDLIPAFVQALQAEIAYVGLSNPNYTIKTIFFGGGTPSLIPIESYQSIFHTISNHFKLAEQIEISIETNPNDLNDDYLSGLFAVGFNRLSIGLQTTDHHLLQLYERQHTTEQVFLAIHSARKVGFQNISLDLIFGAPGETVESWQQTLIDTVRLSPQHLSMYNLMLKGNTSLTKQVERGYLPTPDDDIAADMYDLATSYLQSQGFQQYEISNWTQPSFESRHNLQYWLNLPYLGLGPGAHGYANGIRYIVTRFPNKYIEKMQSPVNSSLKFPRTPAVSKVTRVTKDDEISETIMMGLRLVHRGLIRQEFIDRFGMDIYEIKKPAIDKHINYGLLEMTNQYIRLSEKGRLLSNAVLRDMI